MLLFRDDHEPQIPHIFTLYNSLIEFWKKTFLIVVFNDSMHKASIYIQGNNILIIAHIYPLSEPCSLWLLAYGIKSKQIVCSSVSLYFKLIAFYYSLSDQEMSAIHRAHLL